ncbi:MAG: ATP-dependent helicase, partial [Planctomycetia bacterium]
MLELAISPHGHLLLREAPSDDAERPVAQALLDAYATSAARGMLASASGGAAALPASFEFARSIGRLYLAELCRAAVAELGGALPAIPPPTPELARTVLQA